MPHNGSGYEGALTHSVLCSTPSRISIMIGTNLLYLTGVIFIEKGLNMIEGTLIFIKASSPN